jgi:hypothetical protein
MQAVVVDPVTTRLPLMVPEESVAVAQGRTSLPPMEL